MMAGMSMRSSAICSSCSWKTTPKWRLAYGRRHTQTASLSLSTTATVAREGAVGPDVLAVVDGVEVPAEGWRLISLD